MTILFWGLASSSFLLFGGFALVSHGEGERRATLIASLFAVVLSGLFAMGAFSSVAFQRIILFTILSGGVMGMILFLLPVGHVDHIRDIPQSRFDERDIMFARARLKPGSERYRAYYDMRPENEVKDNLFRAQPGLLSSKAKLADPVLFAVPEASFTLTETMHAMVEGIPAVEKVALPENPVRTGFIKSLAKYFGALEVGVTELKPEHVYSHIGRGSGTWGTSLQVEHKFAIAITVEMSYEIMGSAPHAPVVLESAHQYVEAGRAAVQLAQTIRAWGYPARAHMDGDYRVICPLVARDAGLGEIGRMGLLMTPQQGPRVRIAVVTTDLELIPDRKEPAASMLDFCRICGKCAENCPPKAITFEDRIEIDGAFRWRIDSDLCFRYWNATGTDCGRCMTICPYSHPDNFYHNLVRWGNVHSGVFRRAALRLDDLFYGRRPARRDPPMWVHH